jgi:hypothetical protein
LNNLSCRLRWRPCNDAFRCRRRRRVSSPSTSQPLEKHTVLGGQQDSTVALGRGESKGTGGCCRVRGCEMGTVGSCWRIDNSPGDISPCWRHREHSSNPSSWPEDWGSIGSQSSHNRNGGTRKPFFTSCLDSVFQQKGSSRYRRTDCYRAHDCWGPFQWPS